MPSYTASLSTDPALVRSRTSAHRSLMNLFPSSRLFDRSLGYVSIVTSTLLALYTIIGVVALSPFIFYAELSKRSGEEKNKNISTTSGGSRTAIKTLSARSQMYLQNSGGPDYLAARLMRHISLFGDNVIGSFWFSKSYLWLARLNFYITGRIFADQIASFTRMKLGETAFLQGRTCWLDDCVETFVREHQDTSTTGRANVNVVVLGAGYDSRCYRLNLVERGVQTFEIDTAETQKVKLHYLSKAGIETGSTKFIPCDFMTESWMDKLLSNGFDVERPTCFVWEGVTPYLDRDAVKGTIEKLGICAMGSCIGFDYVDSTWALTPEMVKATKRWGEPWLFGMAGEEPEDFIEECARGAECELTVWDHLKYKEIIKRYIPKHCDGRPIGYLDDFGGFLLVGKV